MKSTRDATFLFVQAALLLVAGVAFERGFAAFERAIPRSIYREASFSMAYLAEQAWSVLVILLFALPFLPPLRARLGWGLVDSMGGFRWLAFGVAATLAWTHAGHPINDYWGQEHLLDRWLLCGLAIAILRSPLLIAVFVFEMTLSRGQLQHPANTLTPIADELSLRVLGAIFAGAVMNGWLASSAFKSLGARWQKRSDALRIDTPTLVFALLCFVGGYYGYAGIAKLTIGATPLDWVRDVHLENLFVGAYLNGWNLVGGADRMLGFAKVIEAWSIPFAALTLVIECATIFLLVHRRLTLVLVVSIALMHLGILLMSGIFFWKWLVVDLLLALWLYHFRHHPGLLAIYSPRAAIVSVVVIAISMASFGLNEFTWWNTRWYSILDVEVRDARGRAYRVDYADFAPSMLIDFMQPEGAQADTFIYGMTFSQGLMERVQNTDAPTLRAFLEQRRSANARDPEVRKKRADDLQSARDFIVQTLRNRNQRAAQRGPESQRLLPFIFPAPALHSRFLQTHNLYRDQAPAVEARIRHVEIFYTGDTLVRLSDEVLATFAVPTPETPVGLPAVAGQK